MEVWLLKTRYNVHYLFPITVNHHEMQETYQIDRKAFLEYVAFFSVDIFCFLGIELIWDVEFI